MKVENETELPRLRSKLLDDRITVPMEGALKRELLSLKAHGIDHLEFIRRILRRELPLAKKKVS